jgi:hypothetical protein
VFSSIFLSNREKKAIDFGCRNPPAQPHPTAALLLAVHFRLSFY